MSMLKEVTIYFDILDSEAKIFYLIKLTEAGGRLDCSEIRERICNMDEHIAKFEQYRY